MLSILICNSCSASPKPNQIVARITFYHGDTKTSSGAKPQKGITVAAHPDFKFGTRVKIKELSRHFGDSEFVVQDRGSAVTKKKASHGKAYVFDVFVNSFKEYLFLKNHVKEYMTVEIDS